MTWTLPPIFKYKADNKLDQSIMYVCVWGGVVIKQVDLLLCRHTIVYPFQHTHTRAYLVH